MEPPKAPITAHPRSPFTVTTGAAPDRPGTGYGLLKVHLRTSTRASKPTRQIGPRHVDRYPLPGVPLLLVDAEPVVQGPGTAWVRLPVGRHRCSVQAGGFAGWWTVAITQGAVIELEANPDRAWTFVDHEPPLEPARFARKIRYWTILAYGPVVLAVLFALCFLPASLLRGLTRGTLSTAESTTAGLAVYGALALCLWSILAARHVGTMRRSKRHLRFQERLAAQPRHTGGPPVHELALITERLPAASGDGGILLDLTWETVWQRIDRTESIDWWLLEQYGEPELTDHRPWIPDPTVVLGEYDLDLTWGRWWMPLPPGTHDLEFAAPRWGEGERAPDSDHFVTWSDAVTVAPGRISHVRLNCRAVQYFEEGRYALRLTGLAHDARGYPSDGNLIGFRRKRLERRPLDGQTDERLHHSIIEQRV